MGRQGSPAACQKDHTPFCAMPSRVRSTLQIAFREGAATKRNRMAKQQRPIPSMKISLHPKGLSAEGTGGTGILAAALLMGIALPLGLWLILA